MSDPQIPQIDAEGKRRKTVVLMCQSRFAAMIVAGTKPHTIRPVRKRPVKVGDWLSLREWTGRPYASPQRILREAECLAVEPIIIQANGIVRGLKFISEVHSLARADGFAHWFEMRSWFEATHSLPFEGVLISWLPSPNLRPSAQSADTSSR